MADSFTPIDVPMDALKIIKTRDSRVILQSSGAAVCFCIAFRGADRDGVPILGIAHTSHGEPLTWVLNKMFEKAHELGNVTRRPLFEIAGGMYNEEEGVDTTEEEEEVGELKGKGTYNIGRTVFNLVESEEDDGLTMSITTGSTRVQLEKVQPRNIQGTSFARLRQEEGMDEVFEEDEENDEEDFINSIRKKLVEEGMAEKEGKDEKEDEEVFSKRS